MAQFGSRFQASRNERIASGFAKAYIIWKPWSKNACASLFDDEMRWLNVPSPFLKISIGCVLRSNIVFGADRLHFGLVRLRSGGNPVIYTYSLDGEQLWTSERFDVHTTSFPMVDPFDRVIAPWGQTGMRAITPDGESAILSVTSQDDTGAKFFSALFLKRIEDDGGGTARLIDNNKRYFDTAPIIAPDGSGVLVFQSNRGDLSKPDIFRINFADNRVAGGVSRITNDQRYNYGPTYTDSNREVVYLSLEPNYPLAKPQLSNVKLDGALPTQFQLNAEEVSHREPAKIYFTRVDEASGKRQIYSVAPDTELEDALRLMDEKNVAQVPVMLDGRLLGMIGRDHLISLILNRTALGKS